MSGVTRRDILRAGGASLGLTLAGCSSREPHAGVLGRMERLTERVQQALFNPNKLARELPAGSETPMGKFPVYFIGEDIPDVPSHWQLKVSGMVARPATFSLGDLTRMPRTDVRVRHYCVEGWSAVASWHGVRVRDLAERVGADPRAPYLEFRSFDLDKEDDTPYTSSWDRASALHPQTILAYGMNGQPLGPDHGAPLRLYSAVKLGYKMVKYLSEILFLPQRTGGYWEDQGYEWFAGV
jgi:DMSO/TMAO reductase YedYZ molybdopterin-dependent catalytic subunit